MVIKILPIWLNDSVFQENESKAFTTVYEQLMPDLIQWAQSRNVDWRQVLKRWVVELFTRMSKQCVNRLWSVLLFEGYGSLLPLSLSILLSNKQILLSLPSNINCQNYLETEFLSSITNIGDIMKNFRILIATNQSTSRFFDLSYIRNLRVQYLEIYVSEIRTVHRSTTTKLSLIETHNNECDKYINVIDSFIHDIGIQIESIRDSAKNDPDIHTQLLRLERITGMFSECRPHLITLQVYMKRYLYLLQQRTIMLLDALDSLSTISQSTNCLPEGIQIESLHQNIIDSSMNLSLIGLRADIISILLASQVCVWNLTSITWHLQEMKLRKVHTEMSWMCSLDMAEMLKPKRDYLSTVYEDALRISQVCASSILKFISDTHVDLFNTYFSPVIPEMKGVYQGLQKKWRMISEEEDLVVEFQSLVKHTGFVM